MKYLKLFGDLLFFVLVCGVVLGVLASIGYYGLSWLSNLTPTVFKVGAVAFTVIVLGSAYIVALDWWFSSRTERKLRATTNSKELNKVIDDVRTEVNKWHDGKAPCTQALSNISDIVNRRI